MFQLHCSRLITHHQSVTRPETVIPHPTITSPPHNRASHHRAVLHTTVTVAGPIESCIGNQPWRVVLDPAVLANTALSMSLSPSLWFPIQLVTNTALSMSLPPSLWFPIQLATNTALSMSLPPSLWCPIQLVTNTALSMSLSPSLHMVSNTASSSMSLPPSLWCPIQLVSNTALSMSCDVQYSWFQVQLYEPTTITVASNTTTSCIGHHSDDIELYWKPSAVMVVVGS